jgi:hypothetical protein
MFAELLAAPFAVAVNPIFFVGRLMFRVAQDMKI